MEDICNRKMSSSVRSFETNIKGSLSLPQLGLAEEAKAAKVAARKAEIQKLKDTKADQLQKKKHLINVMWSTALSSRQECVHFLFVFLRCRVKIT